MSFFMANPPPTAITRPLPEMVSPVPPPPPAGPMVPPVRHFAFPPLLSPSLSRQNLSRHPRPIAARRGRGGRAARTNRTAARHGLANGEAGGVFPPALRGARFFFFAAKQPRRGGTAGRGGFGAGGRHVGLRRARHLLQRQLRRRAGVRRGAGAEIPAAAALQGVPAAVPRGHGPDGLHLQIQVLAAPLALPYNYNYSIYVCFL